MANTTTLYCPVCRKNKTFHLVVKITTGGSDLYECETCKILLAS